MAENESYYGPTLALRIPGKPEYVALVNSEGHSFMVSREMLVDQPDNVLDLLDLPENTPKGVDDG